jgi:hypothetical protein
MPSQSQHAAESFGCEKENTTALDQGEMRRAIPSDIRLLVDFMTSRSNLIRFVSDPSACLPGASC